MNERGFGLLLGGTALLLGGLGLFIRWGSSWGSTPEERQVSLPGDRCLAGSEGVKVAMNDRTALTRGRTAAVVVSFPLGVPSWTSYPRFESCPRDRITPSRTSIPYLLNINRRSLVAIKFREAAHTG
jgi:hypothetical protein